MRNKNKDNYFQKNNTVITGESRSKAKEKTSEEIEKETAYFFENGGEVKYISSTDTVPGSRKVRVPGLLKC